MGVIFETGYTLPGSDEPTTHARIAHSGNWQGGGTIAASTTATGFFADAPDNSLTYEKWQPSALPATWENDFGSANITDYCAIAGHTLGTNGNTLQVQYYNGSVWVDIINELIEDDEPIFCIFEPLTRQRFRIRISNGTAPTISVVRFGSALQMQSPIYRGISPLNMNRKTKVRSTQSESGQWLGRTKIRNSLSGSFDWSHLTDAWVRANIDPFIKAIEDEPFFIAWRPATFTDVHYCWTTQNPRAPRYSGPLDFMTFDVNVEALGYE